MPLKSKAQLRWMAANKPEMLHEWAAHTKSVKKLPQRVQKGSSMSLVEVAEVSKWRAPIRRVTNTRMKLGPNEFWHGTTKESAEQIKHGGFQLANPKGEHRGIDAALRGDRSMSRQQANAINPAADAIPGKGDKLTRTRRGRPRATGDLGPGVYGTKDAKLAWRYSNVLSNKDPHPKHGRRGVSGGEVVRMRYTGGKPLKAVEDIQDPHGTPKAAKSGHGGVEHHGMKLGPVKVLPHQVAIGNPRHVEYVHTPKKLAAGWTPGEYTAAGAATVGTGYGGKKLHDRRRPVGKSLVEIRKAEQPQFAPIVDNRIKQRKKKAKHLSEASAVLGGAALGLKAPSYAAMAAKKLPKSKVLARVGRAAPKADSISEHVVPASLGVGALGSINFARLQGQEAKRPGAVEPKVSKASWTPHVSPAAEEAYNDLGRRKRRRYSDAAVYGGFGGIMGLSGHDLSKLPLAPGRHGKLARAVTLSGVAGVTAASGYGAARRVQEGRALQGRRSKIKAKGLERQAAGQYGRGRPKPLLKDVEKALGLRPLAPRAGGLMRTTTGKVVTRRGAIPGTGKFTPTLRRIA
jgi:hypothetical protein